jgi:tetratricopeptide (TPR) repeat protein
MTFRGRILDLSLAACLVALVLALYAQTFQFQFINFDDPDYVYANPRVLQGLTADGVKWAFSTLFISNWHPLTWLSHMADVEWFGLDAGKHHRTSVVLHAINAVLLFGFLQYATGSRWRSLCVATIFAAHPLRAESVAWVSERKDVLSTLFGLLCLLSYVWWTRRRGVWRYLLVFFCLTLGLMAKSMLVTFPALLLLLDGWPLGRWAWADLRSLGHSEAARQKLTALLVEKLPLMVPVIVVALVTYVAQDVNRSVVSVDHFSPGLRVANSIASLGEYVLRTFDPRGLAIFYPHPGTIPGGKVNPAKLAFGGVILLGMTTLAVTTLRRAPFVATGWFWFVGTLVPVIGLVQVGSQSHADRYTYVPGIGLAILIAWGLGELVRARPGLRVPVAVVLLLLLGGMSVAAYRQIMTWRDTATVMSHAIRVVPNNYTAHNNLGTHLDQKGDAAGAAENYLAALRIRPHDAFANANYSTHLLAAGKYEQAMQYVEAALKTDPSQAEPWTNYGNILLKLGRNAEAIRAYEKAISLKPDMALAHHNLALTLAEDRRFDRAARHWEEALRLDPDYADARLYFGIALGMMGDESRARVQFSEALRLRPDHPLTLNACAWWLATRPEATDAEVREAERLARRAIQLAPAVASYHDTLGVALARQGRFPEAISSANEGIRLCSEGESQLRRDIDRRIRLYQERRPYLQASPSTRRVSELDSAGSRLPLGG